MFVVRWIQNLVHWLTWTKVHQGKILLLGIDNAGKTTLLKLLKDDKISAHEPTFHAHSEQVKVGKVTFEARDLGGHTAERRMWKDNLFGIDGIVFLIDSSEVKDEKKRERRRDAEKELANLIANEDLKEAGVPIAVVGNKIDALGAVNEATLRHEFKIQETERRKLFMCCLLKREGHLEPFQWLSTFITDAKKRAKWPADNNNKAKEPHAGGGGGGGGNDAGLTLDSQAEL